MGRPRLPDHLEILLSDEPVVDLYAHGPWRVPDGLLEEIAERARVLNNDPRVAELPYNLTDFYGQQATVVGAELWCIVPYLSGIAAIRGGNRADLEAELLNAFRGEQLPVNRDPAWFSARTNKFRPPGDWLITAAGDDPAKRELAYQLARECLDVFAGIEPFERRRQAAIKLYELPKPEEESGTPYGNLVNVWARAATDEILADLPELAGTVNYLEWVVSGFVAAHDRLRAAISGWEAAAAVACLLQQAGVWESPAEFAVFTDTTLYENVKKYISQPFAESWATEVRAWLARGLIEGEADACRAWLDMGMRLEACFRGLPEGPNSAGTLLPVTSFQRAVRDLFRRRPLVNPLERKFTVVTRAAQEQPVPARPEFSLVGQPELASAIRDLRVDRPSEQRRIRLLVAGPDATGRRTAVSALIQNLVDNRVVAGARWISDPIYTTLDASNALQQLNRDVRECIAERNVLVLDGLDRIVGIDRCGTAVAEELRRSLKRHPELHVIAVCGLGGDTRLFDTNPALYQLFRVARTHEFTDKQYAELLKRAVARRGASISRAVSLAAGVLLTRTPPLLNLRGARLVEHLAEQSVLAARKRAKVGPSRSVGVTEADLPRQLVPGDVAGSDPQAELDSCVGLEKIKRELALLVAEEKAHRMRREAGMVVDDRARHMVFTGPPGTGKTMVARILGRMFAATGVLSSGHIVVVDRADLVHGEGWEIGPRVRRLVDRAVGGVLCVESAHELQPSDDDWRNRETVNALVAAVQSHGKDLVVVLTGPDAGVNGLLKSEPDLAAFFPSVLRFPPLTEDSFVALFEAKAEAAGFTLRDGVVQKVRSLVKSTPTGNARMAIGLLERAIARQARRVLADDVVGEDESLHEILAEDVPDTLATTSWVELPNDPLSEIDKLIGLDSVKHEVRLLVAEAKADRMRREAGIPLAAPTRHLVFTGSPGTAKTTMARLLAAVYAKLGLLSSGHLVEVSRGDLIGEYLGQTAPKVRAAVAKALGGVLFIDEAYSLTEAWYDDYGSEAIAELIKLMEEHREDLVVIVAGYDGKMAKFMDKNPGLASRFPTKLRFPDYSDDELVAIFKAMTAKAGYELHPDVIPAVRELLRRTPRGESFGNGRFVRNVFDRAVALQGHRITSSAESPEVRLLLAEDLPKSQDTGHDVPTGQYL
ncbi:AAA family ATPase [Kibdelosporangium persicum]|uniref:ATPase family protein associated with various cellular activities (AAA) n=1 Tax=Kibdelosporangium persicum TaxID=2698649 RepID=A0ABX2F423_9PSEU|nr:AAA family ATPase [Kibdelosporangium persicum]NRN66079.1 ATPase family protein associated with various cellular activities (AAA) [Kibdelosporangium persicum]